MVAPRPPARTRWITLLDAGLIIAASAALVILLGGRTRIHAAGLRIVLRGTTNVLVITVLMLAARLWLGRGVLYRLPFTVYRLPFTANC